MINTLNELKQKIADLGKTAELLTAHKNYDLIEGSIALAKTFTSIATDAIEWEDFNQAERCLKNAQECVLRVVDLCS